MKPGNYKKSLAKKPTSNMAWVLQKRPAYKPFKTT